MAATAPRRFESEELLLGRARLGDEKAFCTLVHPHERALYTVAWVITGEPQSAEDMVQRAAVSAWMHFGGYASSSFRTWLLGFLVAEARKTRSGGILPAETDGFTPRHMEDWEALPSGLLEDPAFRERLQRAMLKLPLACRAVLVLRDCAGIPVAECAQVLGIGEAEARNCLLRARLQLRDLLAETGSGRRRAHKKGGAR